MNLVLVAMLDDRGYVVVLSEGKSFLHQKSTRQVKKIRVRVKNLYKLDADGCASLMGKVDRVVSRDEGELWHMILSHLHHGALKVMQQISMGLTKGTLE